MNWRVKGIIQKVLSITPAGAVLNDALQHTLGTLRNFDGHVAGKVDDWSIITANLAEVGVPPTGRHFVEIGTGWLPTLPICFFLAGADRCDTFDVVRHMQPHVVRRLTAALTPHLVRIATSSQRPVEEVRTAHAALCRISQLPELLAATRIGYHAPADAAATGLPDNSVDVVFSNSVLEHIPREVIARLMIESRRILRPGGVAIHSVGCNDHYRHIDRQLSPINYLRFSETKWRFWNNDFQYQNRLRPQDFINLTQAAGMQLVLCKSVPRPDLLATLAKFPLAPEFRHYPPEQICSLSVDFVARKPA